MMARYLLRVCRWSQVTPVDQRGLGCQWLSVAEWPPYLSLPNWGITFNVTLLLSCIWYIYLYPYIYLYLWMHVLGTSGQNVKWDSRTYMKLSGWGMLKIIVIWLTEGNSWRSFGDMDQEILHETGQETWGHECPSVWRHKTQGRSDIHYIIILVILYGLSKGTAHWLMFIITLCFEFFKEKSSHYTLTVANVLTIIGALKWKGPSKNSLFFRRVRCNIPSQNS